MKTTIPVKCIFCNENKAYFWFTKSVEFSAHRTIQNKKSYPIHRCRKCNGAFVFPIPDQAELLDFYANIQEYSTEVNNFNELQHFKKILDDESNYPNSVVDAARISKNLRELSNGDNALDIGAGYGFFSRTLIDADFKVDAIELSNTSIALYKLMNGFEPNRILFDTQFSVNNINKYDVVILSQVLEHLPINHFPVKNIHMILKGGGVCSIAVPHFNSYLSILQGKNDMFITPPEHINFFSKDSLIRAFELEGFSLIKIHTISRFDYKVIKSKFGGLAPLISAVLKLFFRFSDAKNLGMFINAYFRKI